MRNLWPKTRTDLLARLKTANDQSSWEEFYNIYWRAIYSYALCQGLSKEDAEDTVQEVFIKIIRNFPAFEYDSAKGRLRSWVKTIARTTIIDFFRRKSARLAGKLKSVGGDDDLINRIKDPNQKNLDDVWEEQWERSILLNAMERVKQRVKEENFRAFYLCAIENEAPSAAAHALGMDVNSIYVIKSRMMKMIREEAEKLISETQ